MYSWRTILILKETFERSCWFKFKSKKYFFIVTITINRQARITALTYIMTYLLIFTVFEYYFICIIFSSSNIFSKNFNFQFFLCAVYIDLPFMKNKIFFPLHVKIIPVSFYCALIADSPFMNVQFCFQCVWNPQFLFVIAFYETNWCSWTTIFFLVHAVFVCILCYFTLIRFSIREGKIYCWRTFLGIS